MQHPSEKTIESLRVMYPNVTEDQFKMMESTLRDGYADFLAENSETLSERAKLCMDLRLLLSRLLSVKYVKPDTWNDVLKECVEKLQKCLDTFETVAVRKEKTGSLYPLKHVPVPTESTSFSSACFGRDICSQCLNAGAIAHNLKMHTVKNILMEIHELFQ
jgi:hypothetical protein